MNARLLGLLLCASVVIFSTDGWAETKIKPGMVGGTPPPNAPSPPNNATQREFPSAPGVIVTYPNNPPTKVKCTRNGKPVDC